MKQKGAVLRSLLAAVEKVYGPKGLAQVRAALPPAARTELEHPILAVQWYPLELTAEVQLAIKNTVGRGSWEASHRLGLEAAKADFSGPYRVFLRAVQYDTIFDRLELAWNNYNSQGKIVWTDRTHGHSTGHIAGVVGFNNGIWHGVAGRGEGILLLSGAKSADFSIRDPTSTSCTIEGLWF